MRAAERRGIRRVSANAPGSPPRAGSSLKLADRRAACDYCPPVVGCVVRRLAPLLAVVSVCPPSDLPGAALAANAGRNRIDRLFAGMTAGLGWAEWLPAWAPFFVHPHW